MPDEAPFQDFPSYVERSSQKPRVFLIFGILLLLVVGLFAGLYFLGASSKKSSVASVPTPIVTPTVPPAESDAATSSAETTSAADTTPSPTEKTDEKASSERSDLQVSVLNGSGVTGAAKGISSHLGDLGYTIKTVGNADSFTYENITVKVKKSNKTVLSQLKKDIQEFDSTLKITESVDDAITADAVVIVGK